jgi:hypothetical protein
MIAAFGGLLARDDRGSADHQYAVQALLAG